MKRIKFKLLILSFLITAFSYPIKAQNWQNYDSLSHAFLQERQYDSALVYTKKSLAEIKQLYGELDNLYADRLTILLELFFYKGEFVKAIEKGNEELKIRKQIQGKKHPAYATTLNNLATMHANIDNYDYAESLYIEAMRLREEILGNNHPHYALTINNLAGMYNKIGNYKKAEPLLLEALEIRKNTVGADHPEFAQSLNNLAALYNAMGNYNKAEEYYIRSMEIRRNSLGEKHPAYVLSLNNLARLYDNIKKYDEAENLFLEVLDIQKKTIGKNHPSYAISLNNLAALYNRIGNYELAEKKYLMARDILREALGDKHTTYSTIVNNIGIFYFNIGEYEKAKELFYESLNIQRINTGSSHLNYGVTSASLAKAYFESNEYFSSQKHFLTSIDVFFDNIYRQFSFLSETEKELYLNTVKNRFDDFAYFGLYTKEAIPSISGDVYNMLLKTKGILLKSSTAMRNAVLNSENEELIRQFENWTELKQKITNLYGTEVEKRDADPEELERQAYEVEKLLVRKSAEFSDFEELMSITWEDVRSKLLPNEAAIEFTHFSHGKDSILYCGLILKHDSEYPLIVPLFEENQLAEILNRITLTDVERVSAIYGKKEETDTSLYKLIWEPMLDYLIDIQTVNISPSGLLHKVSFSSLGTGMNRFLLDDYNINILTTTAYINSGKELNLDKNTSIGLFGGINYSTISDEDSPWSYLQGTHYEIKAIAPILNKVSENLQVRTEHLATKDEFKTISSESNIVHIATHGFFFPDPETTTLDISADVIIGEVDFRGVSRYAVESFISNKDPLMRSGLVFAGVNDFWRGDKAVKDDDGVMTALEVINIDLRNNFLMVLSACETGLGDIAGSEGVYGLQRAFKMAGTDFIIMSLWQVPDIETAEFMEKFYYLLIDKKNLREAFRETQIQMRQKYDPFFWAAFVLVE